MPRQPAPPISGSAPPGRNSACPVWRHAGVLPVLLVAIAALVLGSLGTAVAGDSVVAITKKTVKKIANKQIKKKAPTLSVAKAKTADTATSAATAGSAGDVDGYSANELSRAASAAVEDFGPLTTAAFTNIVATQITAPKAGILVITGQSRVNRLSGSVGETTVIARGTVDGTAATQASVVRAADAGVTESTIYITGAFPVAAGNHTVALQAVDDVGDAYLSFSSVTVTFVPFGPGGGAGTLSADLRSAPAGANR